MRKDNEVRDTSMSDTWARSSLAELDICLASCRDEAVRQLNNSRARAAEMLQRTDDDSAALFLLHARRVAKLQSALDGVIADWRASNGTEDLDLPCYDCAVLDEPIYAPQPAASTTSRRKTKATPVDAYYMPIMETLARMGGAGDVKDVLEEVYVQLRDQLTDYDHALLTYTRAARWRNVAQWARRELVKAGMLRNDSPWGVWELTELGYEALG